MAQADAPSESGDCVHMVSRNDGRELFFLADVAGHDARAARVAGELGGCVLDLARQERPGSLLSILNATLAGGWPPDLFVCAVCFWLDPQSGEGAIAAAGQLPPIVKHASSSRPVEVNAEPPLGVVGGHSYAERAFELAAGDVLVAVTDGVTDPLASGQDLLGLSALARLVDEAPADPGAVCATLLRAARRAGIHDDATVLAVAPALRVPVPWHLPAFAGTGPSSSAWAPSLQLDM